MKTVQIVVHLEDHNEYADWCVKNGYLEFDDFVDEETSTYKRHEQVFWYLKHEDGTYAECQAFRDYDEGLFDIMVNRQGLVRTVKEVVVEKVEYVENV